MARKKDESLAVQTAPGTSIVGEADKDGNKIVSFNPIFPILTGSVRLPEIDIQRMAVDILKFVGNNENYEGGWTSYFAPQADISKIPGMDDIANAAVGVAGAMARELKLNTDPAKATLQLWVSVIRKGGFHGLHSHPGSVISGTFYIQCDEKSAPLMLMNPTRNYRHHEVRPETQDLGPFTSEQLMMKPEAGQMLIWPSWLEHHVAKHMDERPRISVSFNVDYPFFNTK